MTEPTADTTQAPERVLVVDDDAALREALRRSLVRLGYEVELAADGLEGLRRAAAWKPAVIVLDLRMRGMTGHAFLQRFGSYDLDAAIVVASGDGTMDDVIEVMRHGAVDYLKKPWTPSELLAVITRAAEIYARRCAARAASAAPPPATTTAPAEARVPRPGTPPITAHAFADVLRQLERGEIQIPSLPTLIVELHALLANSEAPIEKIAALVERDQGVLTRVLRMGRSAQYARIARNADLRTIISRIGFRQLQTLVDTIWLNDCFQVRDARYRQYTLQVSRHGVARALAMRALAEMTGQDGFTAYIGGLFADVGASFLLRIVVEDVAGPAPEPGAVLAFVRTAHEEIGGRMLATWGHDDATVRLAHRHHAGAPPAPPSPGWSLFILATEVAVKLTQAPDLTADDDWPNDGLVDRCAAALGLGAGVRRRIGEKLHAEFASMVETLA